MADDLDDELFALAGGDDEADVEEGEASSVGASSPNSLGSGAMDESDSERDDADVVDRDRDVPYPLEGKYLDAKDRSYINGLPQVERERILAERVEEINRAKFSAELIRKARQVADVGTSDRKRKATSPEPEHSQRVNLRQKVKGKTTDKLEAYKRDREQRGQQRQRVDDRRNGRRRSSSGDRGDGSDVDAEGESEVEWDDHVHKVPKEEEPATLIHFDSVRVGRGFFGKVCFYPGFEDAMTGTFARIGTGQDAQRRTLYKMAQIKGFTTGKPYVFEGKNGQRIATDQYVIAQHGSVKKEYTFSYLSNQSFTESDLETYKQSLSETNSKIPTQSFLKKKYEDIKRVENHSWTDAEISEKLKKQNAYAHLLRANVPASISTAKSSSDDIAKRILELNKLNRKQDSERVRKALIEERRQEMRERKQREKEFLKKKQEDDAKKKAEEEEKKKKKQNSLKVPSIDALFEGSDRSRSATPAISRAGTPKIGEKKERKGLPTFRKPKMEDEIIASIDLGIDIEI
ncbi:plus-3-domain-containing protein [Lojkania enalia]|uniref:Plus-3-domain-containing protein n=1 Tax=Lojkania enalia TaxID=147567 RepID=A0A9P4K1T2_9PLEO|nr:plus-3-domain-containing protein [Didymosphaeria enalia]